MPFQMLSLRNCKDIPHKLPLLQLPHFTVLVPRQEHIIVVSHIPHDGDHPFSKASLFGVQDIPYTPGCLDPFYRKRIGTRKNRQPKNAKKKSELIWIWKKRYLQVLPPLFRPKTFTFNRCLLCKDFHHSRNLTLPLKSPMPQLHCFPTNKSIIHLKTKTLTLHESAMFYRWCFIFFLPFFTFGFKKKSNKSTRFFLGGCLKALWLWACWIKAARLLDWPQIIQGHPWGKTRPWMSFSPWIFLRRCFGNLSLVGGCCCCCCCCCCCWFLVLSCCCCCCWFVACCFPTGKKNVGVLFHMFGWKSSAVQQFTSTSCQIQPKTGNCRNFSMTGQPTSP